MSRLRGDIDYRGVRFGYSAGKTTICSLLPRFYEITAGTIAIDIRDMTLRSLRSNIGIVQQDVFLFAARCDGGGDPRRGKTRPPRRRDRQPRRRS